MSCGKIDSWNKKSSTGRPWVRAMQVCSTRHAVSWGLDSTVAVGASTESIALMIHFTGHHPMVERADKLENSYVGVCG